MAKHPQPIDLVASSHWAIAVLTSIKFGNVWMSFDLANLDTGRAHRVLLSGISLAVGLNPRSATVRYTEFSTEYPVNFPVFDGADAFTAGVSAGIGVKYSKTILSIWRGKPFPPIATIVFGGWRVGKPKLGSPFSGDLGTRGTLLVDYGNGKPEGLISRHLHLPDPVDDPPHIHESPKEPRRIVIEDVLFDFDSATLTLEANVTLLHAMMFLALRKGPKVIIEGHTDSVGSQSYNMQLSEKRAKAVKEWFVGNHFPGAERFEVKGYGESRPIAPNRKPDGSDDPEGRRKNRRVEIEVT